MFDPQLMIAFRKRAASASTIVSPVPTLGKVHQPQQISNAPSYHPPTQTATQTAPGARDPHPQNTLSSSVNIASPPASPQPKSQQSSTALSKAAPAVNTVQQGLGTSIPGAANPVQSQPQQKATAPVVQDPLERVQANDPRLSNQSFRAFTSQNGVPKSYQQEWRQYAQQHNIPQDDNWTNNYRRFILSKYDSDHAQGAASNPVWQESRNIQQQRIQESQALSARHKELQQEMETLGKWKRGIDTTMDVLDWVPVVGSAARAGEGFGNAIGGNQSWGSALGNAAWRIPLGVAEGFGAGALTKGYRAMRAGVPLATEFAPQLARVGQYGGKALSAAEQAGSRLVNGAKNVLGPRWKNVAERVNDWRRGVVRPEIVENTAGRFGNTMRNVTPGARQEIIQAGRQAAGRTIPEAAFAAGRWKIPPWVKGVGRFGRDYLAFEGLSNLIGGGSGQAAAAAGAAGAGVNPLAATMAGMGSMSGMNMFRPRTYGDEIREALASRRFY